MDESFQSPNWRRLLAQALAIWLPAAAVATGLALLVYGAVQQDLRLNADDPQIELAHAKAEELDAGRPPAAVIPEAQLDLAHSLAPFVLVFDTNRHLLASAANLHGRPVDFPTGVFDQLRSSGEVRVSWQPEPGVRSATVAVAWRGGFVVVGRSLQPTEQRIDQIGRLVTLGWLGTLVMVAVAALVAALISPAHGAPAAPRGAGFKEAIGASAQPQQSELLTE